MTTSTQLPDLELEDGIDVLALAEGAKEKEDKQLKLLIWLLLLLVSLLYVVGATFVRYLLQPAPLPELLPLVVNVNPAPHYLFSIYGVESPVGVALSPQGDRIYVTETGGERLIRIFDQDGDQLGSFAPPRTGQFGDRSPVYLATDSTGRVFVTDRAQHAILVYDSDGNYLDTILGPDLTLSEYLFKHVEGLQIGDSFAYNLFEPNVYYRPAGSEDELTFPAPDPAAWSPLGIRIDETGRMLLTDVASESFNVVRVIPSNAVMAASWQEFDPSEIVFGEHGQGNGQFIFPNVAVSDSQGRIYVTDGNNGRVSVWDNAGHFLFHLGQGVGDGALNLPRGAAIDTSDRLYVVDAVGQDVKVYDVSGPEVDFLFTFGDWGASNGQFNYPNDIAIDNVTGRLYVTDRENHRVQVWLY
ncbi:MAG: NHL repeat-containing protein [Chloroflexi bacterium]|nr:NHL repeat-containing protein [Chloroflexota bacterium]